MENSFELDISKYGIEGQTETFWQCCRQEKRKTRQDENEEFAAQIEAYEAWQAAIWLD